MDNSMSKLQFIFQIINHYKKEYKFREQRVQSNRKQKISLGSIAGKTMGEKSRTRPSQTCKFRQHIYIFRLKKTFKTFHVHLIQQLTDHDQYNILTFWSCIRTIKLITKRIYQKQNLPQNCIPVNQQPFSLGRGEEVNYMHWKPHLVLPDLRNSIKYSI